MIAGVVATALALATAFYAASGKPDSDPDITRAAPIDD
jgi:hypothetical protein